MPEPTNAYPAEDVVEVQRATAQLEGPVAEAVHELSPEIRLRAPNALLNIATAWVLAAEGPVRTAAILTRLANAILAGQRPDGEDAIRLTGYDA